MEFTQEERLDIIRRFKAHFPTLDSSKLSFTDMKEILDGELVPVLHSHNRKFCLMTKEDVAPGGRLDKMNQETRERNRKIRRVMKERKLRALREIDSNPDLHPIRDLMIDLTRILKHMK